jgi:glycosyltransferase involved in cell wall biosynthesis
MTNSLKISAIIPAKNEAAAIAAVIESLQSLKEQGQPLIHRIIVVDNLSNDDTAMIAKEKGAVVVFEPQPGYGSACMAGMHALVSTELVLFIDGDNSCDSNDIPEMIRAITEGADMVVGSRILGTIEPHAMTWTQRIGTHLICRLMQLRTGIPVSDLGPLRVIHFDKLLELNMRDRRFGWTAEMQTKAYRRGLKVAEVPVRLKARIGQSKISGTWRGTFLTAYDLLRAVLFSR